MTDTEAPDLPYSIDNPADASDVVTEIRRLSTLTAAIVGANPRMGAALIEDWTKEPGRSVGLQELRTALALESYVGNNGKEIIDLLGEAVPESLGQAIDKLQETGYLHRHEEPA